MKRFLIYILAFIFMLLNPIQAFATYSTSYTIAFVEYYGMNGIATARAPFHLSNLDTGGDDFANHKINGPNNQPRLINGVKDVHNGTDINGSYNVPVYPMFYCLVKSVVQPTSTSNLGYVIVQYDVNNNGIFDDNYYVKYLHIDPENNFTPNSTTLTPSNRLGVIDSAKSYPAHLHLQDTNSTGSGAYSSIKLFKYFRSAQPWGYGYYMDTFAGEYNSSGIFYISVNELDLGRNNAPGQVEFFYRIGSNGTWQKGPNMTLYMTGNDTGGYYRYSINLKSATGATSGQVVDCYFAAIRTDSGIGSSDYNWSLWPQHYTMPHKTPSEILASGNTIFYRSLYIP